MRNRAGHCGGSVALAKIGRLPVSPAVDLQAFSVVEFKKISNGFCSRRLKLEALESVFATILGK